MKKYILLLVVGALYAFSSCSDLLDEKVYDTVDSGIFDDSEESGHLLVNGALATINQGQFVQYGDYIKISELDSDHLLASDWVMKGYGSGNFTTETGIIDNWWLGRYALIYRCNFALSKIEPMVKIPEDIKKNMVGQLKFLKAWAYFQLTQAYGDIPIFREVVYTPDEYYRSREPITDVYAYIISLLNESSDLLFESTYSKYEAGRLSKYTAKTLLAQVYCTMASGSLPEGTKIAVIGGPASRKNPSGEQVLIEEPTSNMYSKNKVAGYDFDPQYCYKRVKELCDSIIQYGGYRLYDNYADVWKIESRNGPEFIWQLQASTKINYLRNALSADISGYDPNGDGTTHGMHYRMRFHWYKLFEKTDLRVVEGIRHIYARYVIDWDSPHRGKPWWLYFPKEDREDLLATNPSMSYAFDYNGGEVILTKFSAVSDNTLGTSDYYYPFLRYPVVYLMLAEAENELGNTNAAKVAVDVIRERARASLITNKTMSQIEVRSFILEERARELAMEGIRKWDLIRWGIYLDVMNSIGDTDGAMNKSRRERNLLFPIPVSELNANKYIKENNPGW